MDIFPKTADVAFFPVLFAICALAAASEPRTSKRDGMPQVLIPGGNFTMGAKDADAFGRSDEFPPHRVVLSSYWIDRHEVTNAQFVIFLNGALKGNRAHVYNYCDPGNPVCRITCDPETGACKVEPGYEQHPVLTVSWDGANSYARFVHRRLPTEAEWEFAARGADGRRYPWGNDWAPKQTNVRKSQAGKPRPVETTAGDTSPFGVNDLAGNAQEWVDDAWQEDFYQTSPVQDPSNEGPASRHVVRGGAWCLTEWDARATSRKGLIRTCKRRYLGFRCAETVPKPLPPPAKVSADVLFYAPLDGTVNAAAAQGERRALKAPKTLTYTTGHRGQAALLGADAQRRYWVDYVTEGNIDLETGTLSMWIQPQGWDGDAKGFRYFFMIRDEALAKFYLYRFLEANLTVLAGNGIEGQWGAISEPTTGWQNGEWRHLALTWHGPDVSLYVNGKYVGKTHVPEGKRFRGLPPFFSIGQVQNWDNSKYPAQTAIDEVVIFRRALSAAEIQTEHERTSNP